MHCSNYFTISTTSDVVRKKLQLLLLNLSLLQLASFFGINCHPFAIKFVILIIEFGVLAIELGAIALEFIEFAGNFIPNN